MANQYFVYLRWRMYILCMGMYPVTELLSQMVFLNHTISSFTAKFLFKSFKIQLIRPVLPGSCI